MADGKFDGALAVLRKGDKEVEALAHEVASAVSKITPRSNHVTLRGGERMVPQKSAKVAPSHLLDDSQPRSRSGSATEGEITSAMEEIENEVRLLERAYEKEREHSLTQSETYELANAERLKDAMVSSWLVGAGGETRVWVRCSSLGALVLYFLSFRFISTSTLCGSTIWTRCSKRDRWVQWWRMSMRILCTTPPALRAT